MERKEVYLLIDGERDYQEKRWDVIKFAESEKLLNQISKKKEDLAKLKEHNKSAWDIYGSELCAGGMLAEEEKLQNEINQDMEKFLNTIPSWLREYSGAQL
jgi:predicted component of type VI protein secretion system